MTDPRPIRDALHLVTPSTTAAGGELDEDEIALARAEGLRAVIDAQWSRIIPARFVNATLDAVADERSRRRLAMWADMTRPPNLILLGPVGTGKTSAAVAAVRPAFDHHREVMFAPIREMLDAMRAEFDGTSRDTLGWLCETHRLIIDDLGTEKPTEWTMERLGIVVDRRWAEELPTIVTSNLNQADLEKLYGAHLSSRLFGGALVVVLRGPDRRRK